MSAKDDIRWIQRFNNYSAALKQLQWAVELAHTRSLNDLEKQGVIQAFEFTHELAWNVMKDFLEYQGISNVIGSRDSTREAFNKGLISNGDLWMEMIKSRNESSHTYNHDTAEVLVEKILKNYATLFSEFHISMNKLVK